MARSYHVLKDDVNTTPAKAKACAGDINTKSHSWVEAAARNSTSTISPSNDCESNGEAILLVLLINVLLRGCHIHYHEGEHESVEQFAKAGVVPLEALRR